jgi:hypothetical protein
MRQRKVNGDLHVLGDWTPFEATATFEPALDGRAIFGKYSMHKPDGIQPAVDIRFFNPETKVWTIYWAGDKDYVWQDNPMKGGGSSGNALVFIMPDTFDGHAVLTRYMWRVCSHDEAHWEQAFSNDQGKTWTENWTMDFARKR